MKNILLLACMIALFTSPSFAQIKFGVGPHLGFSFLSVPEPADKYYGFGFGFGAHGDMQIIKFVAVRLNLDYHMFGIDDKKLATDVAGQGVNPSDIKISGLGLSAIGITLNGIGKIPAGIVTPYGFAGFGMHFLSGTDPKFEYQGQDVTAQAGFQKTDGETKFGINVGAGAEFMVVKTVGLSAEFKYVLIFTESKNTSHIPITFGATFWL